MLIKQQIYLRKQLIWISINGVKLNEKNPHAIQYLEYKAVDGPIPMATKWVSGDGKKERGLPLK
jgi:hypothetical protein